ncbi:MAG: CBS domain-containing protein [Actinomycetota bacterium]|nr:CBS domain-containing protein [Actinomycetota bacterium]
MSPDTLGRATVRNAPTLRVDQPVGDALKAMLAAELPALPVVEHDGTFHGIFGEREFISALFPGYLRALRSAAFVPHSIDDVIDRRLECGQDPVSKHANTEHIAVGPDYSDAQLAETFLHHRVLIIPVVEDEKVRAVITRSDFFRALATRFMDR